MDEKTKTAAGIAAGLQGMKYDERRLAELAAEVEVLNDAVRKAEATSQEKMASMTAGLPLPPGFKLPF